MRRREFITLLGAAAAWPLAARAQQMKLPTIGLLGGATASAQAKWTAAFVERLRELGWVEGQTVAIEYRWVEGRFERSPAIIAEFVRLKVDVIVTHATPNVVAAKQVTSVIPIVFPSAGDPVGTGLVASLARPGGNVTGLSVQSAELVQKLVQLLRELLPNLDRLAMLYHIGNPVTALQADAVGHKVRLMPPAYVKPYVKRQKNDAADAEAICEAVTRATMRFVETKTPEQQSCLMLHRTRHLFIRQQTEGSAVLAER